MPMSPPYTNMVLLSTGGSKENNAGFNTPAEDGAWAIQVGRRQAGLVGLRYQALRPAIITCQVQ